MNTPGYDNTIDTRNRHRKMRLHHGEKRSLRAFARALLASRAESVHDEVIMECAKRWAAAKHMTVTP